MPAFSESTCHSQERASDWKTRTARASNAREWLTTEERGLYKPPCEEWRPLRRDLNHITNAIEGSRYLLSLMDEDGQPACSYETWNRAVRFLSVCARRAWESLGVKVDVPAILPGPDGSVDLHWKYASYEMLINIPAEAAILPSYYGDDQDGNSVKGNIASSDNRGLLLWLTTRR
jgi:hypothetical protein